MDDQTDAHVKPKWLIKDLFTMDPKLYPCSENTGHSYWVLLHTVTANLRPSQLIHWKNMMHNFVGGIYPCFHCRDDLHRIWTVGSPSAEGPQSAAVPIMSQHMFIDHVSSAAEASYFLWKLHNIVSIRIYARHWTESDQLHSALWFSKEVWPPMVADGCANRRTLACMNGADKTVVLRALRQTYCLRAAGAESMCSLFDDNVTAVHFAKSEEKRLEEIILSDPKPFESLQHYRAARKPAKVNGKLFAKAIGDVIGLVGGPIVGVVVGVLLATRLSKRQNNVNPDDDDQEIVPPTEAGEAAAGDADLPEDDERWQQMVIKA